MNESYYQLYKSLRDLVQDMEHCPLNDHTRDFVVSTRANCERYDRTNRDFLERWLEEGRRSEPRDIENTELD